MAQHPRVYGKPFSKFTGLRSRIGGEHYNDLQRMLKNKSIIEEYRGFIKNDSLHPVDFYGDRNFRIDHGTSHASIIAPNGDACSITSSINHIFASKIMGETTNIIYNNQMDDFSAPNLSCNWFELPNYPANYIEPGKRPVTSMTPLIALNPDRSVRLVCGASGGTKIITANAQVAAKNLLLERDIARTVDDCRVHHQLSPDQASCEEGFDQVRYYILNITAFYLNFVKNLSGQNRLDSRTTYTLKFGLVL
jgi:gamma-glutamyltranspeptidase/glutathione hydrolase/leukotriene-C4 hydrolase